MAEGLFDHKLKFMRYKKVGNCLPNHANIIYVENDFVCIVEETKTRYTRTNKAKSPAKTED